MLHARRVDLGGNLLRPRPHLPEIARRQKIHVEREALTTRLLGLQRPRLVDATPGPLHVRFGVGDLLLDARGLHDLVKVLDADVATRTRGAGRVVGPDGRADAPPLAVPLRLELVIDVEAAQQDDFPPRLAERGDARLREPVLWVGVVVLEDAAELLVLAVTGAFALEADDKRLGRVGVEEGADLGVEVAEVLGAGEGDGEDGVDEDELVRGRVVRGRDLDAQVEETDAVFELFARGDGLAANRGRGGVVSGGVVGAGDGEGAERGGVGQLAHPGVQVGGAVEGDVGVLGEVDAGEAVGGVFGEGDEGGGLGSGDGAVHLVLAAEVGLEGQAQTFFGVLNEGVDVGFGRGEGRQVN